MSNLVCDVCGKETGFLIVSKTSFSNKINYKVCKKCSDKNAEPYPYLVFRCARAGGYDNLSEKVKQVVFNTLDRLDKGDIEFIGDVHKRQVILIENDINFDMSGRDLQTT